MDDDLDYTYDNVPFFGGVVTITFFKDSGSISIRCSRPDPGYITLMQGLRSSHGGWYYPDPKHRSWVFKASVALEVVRIVKEWCSRN